MQELMVLAAMQTDRGLLWMMINGEVSLNNVLI